MRTKPEKDPAAMRRSPAAPRGQGERLANAEQGEAARLEEIWRRAYAARTRGDLLALYTDWAERYDEDHRAVGFGAHRAAARVLERHLTRRDQARVLDAGAGTGAAGEALAELGFRDLVAVDLSAEMLAVARAKGVYRSTAVADIALPLDAFPDGGFDAAVMVGVFSYGQAPPEALGEVARLVRVGGVLVLTLRTDFFDEDAMGVRSELEALERAGVLGRVQVTDPAPYLPGKDPDALFRVWCYRVTGRPGGGELEEGFRDAVREAFASADDVVELDHSWIWDSRASRLYERYTKTRGYYLTDCEEEILRDRAREIAGDEDLVVELGCGSARKVAHLLAARVEDGAQELAYLPIDVSPGALETTVQEVRRRFGESVRCEPRQGLFEDVLAEIPAGARAKLVLFFGSSIGNLESLADTVAFLERLRARLSGADRLVLGIDLHKDEDVLERAYDEEEACRSFFVHMLRRINEHLGADFDPRVFELSSTYEEEPEHRGVRARRVNLRIAPRVPQRTFVQRLDMEVTLEPGQPVQVGVSRKFEPEAIRALAPLAGFRVERQWFDRRRWFSLNELVPD